MALFDGWFLKKGNPDTERRHLNRIFQDIDAQLDAAIAGGVNTVQAGSGVDVDATDSNNPIVSVESAVISGAADGATAVQPGDNVSVLVNDAGYSTTTGTVESVTGTLGVTVNNTDPANPIVSHDDTSTVANLSSNNSSGVVLQDISFTFDTYGHVTACSVGTVDLDLRYDSLGAAAAAQAASQPLDATLTALAGANWALNALPIGTGADTVAQVAFAANTFPARASTGNLVAKAITDGALSALAGSGGTAGFLRGDGSVSSALTGGFSVDTNVLLVDNTNNRVGMNTSSPQRPLHVVGPSGPVASFPSGPGAANLLILENNANSSFSTVFAAGSSSSFAGFVSGAATSSFAFTYNDALGAWQFAVGTTLPFTLINTGKVRLSLAIERTGVISPAQITSNQTGYNPTGLSTASVLRLDLDAARTINSMAVPSSGTELLIFNRSAFALTLLHDDGATGTASERFLCPGNVNYVIPANGGVKVWYDTASSRWRIVGV